MNDKIINQLKDIITSKLDVNIKPEEIKPDSSLLEDGLGLDSIAVVEFITLIEDTFGFEFSEDDLDMEVFQSMHTLSQFIADHIQETQV